MGKKDDYHTTANNRFFVHFIILLLLKSMHLLAINIKYCDINPALLTAGVPVITFCAIQYEYIYIQKY